ncbi:MAG: carboxypeptidase regulatory-like domain-containing protein, partial [Cyanobacteria bacterium NC_groundwater_1444_Ag_S-0.65um_54_12]|nr:carboxypeptidase regulatory-like domain-containing protein [Cyanobacteria bacterium NC_groundwater_1444_Ag_S-0.65um_54_12]
MRLSSVFFVSLWCAPVILSGSDASAKVATGVSSVQSLWDASAKVATGVSLLSDNCLPFRPGSRIILRAPDTVPEPPSGAALYGKILTSQGKPVVNAMVQAQALTPGAPSARARTDQAGRYVLQGLAPSAVGITVTHPELSQLGPLPVRIWALPEQKSNVQPQFLNIGGMTSQTLPDSHERPAPPLANRLLD